MRRSTLLATSFIAVLAASVGAQQSASNGVSKSSAPSDYGPKCAGCHGAKLEGGFGPSLSSEAFKAKWGPQGFEALAGFIQANMPPSDPGSLSSNEAMEYALMIGNGNGLARKSSEAPSGASVAPPAADADKSKLDESAEGGLGSATANEDAYYHRKVKQRNDKLAKLRPVSDEMLETPPAEDWLSARRTLDSLAFSPLSQINHGNVDKLSVAWSLALPNGTNGITPLVHDGVMFINSGGTVKALDVTDGDELWSYSRPAEFVPLGPPVSQPRSMAIYQDMLYVPTVDNHLIALDVRSGKVLWDHLIQQPQITLRITAAPLVVRGKIFQGMSGCAGAQETGGCFIAALDARTGKELWRFYTVPRKGEPGYNSWNGAPPNERFGGSIWSSGTYDKETGLIFIGVGQTYHIAPLMKKVDAKGNNKALYTNATLALNPDNGKLVWYFQHMERDVWDLDWTFERYAYTMQTASGPRRVVGTIGKLGILDILDAKTGKYLSSFDMGLQDLVTDIDPKTGHKTTNPAAEPVDGVFKHICPFAGGVRNWPATSFDTTRNLLYVPYTKSCMNYVYRADRSLDISYAMAPPANNDGNVGGVMAIDMRTLNPVWVQKQRAPTSSGALATGGGIVFAGDRDRWFRALDSSTGEVIWQTRLDRRLSSNPITFAHDNTQYVAIVSGGGGPNDATQESLTPESPKTAPGITLWVFKTNRSSD